MNVDRKVFQSSMIQAGAYDPETQVLEITFTNGVTYQAVNVPEIVWQGLKQASSPGRHFKQVVEPGFSFTKT